MRATLIAMVAVGGGCGNDSGLLPPDAEGVGGPPGSPLVMVTTPRLNESFYPTQTMTITWSATDDDSPSFSCDVSAVGATTISIASGVATTSGTTKSTPWPINGAAAGSYRARVACTDANALTGSGLSPMFNVSAPPQTVSYATQIQPLWNRSCTSMQCHDAMVPAEGLNLLAAASYGELVNKASSQCASSKLVEPNAPERSYLVSKLAGSGACLIGTRMPKTANAFTAQEIQLIRDWIFNGAPNN